MRSEQTGQDQVWPFCHRAWIQRWSDGKPGRQCNWGIQPQGRARKAQFGLRIRTCLMKARGWQKGWGSWEEPQPLGQNGGAFYRALGLGCLGDPGKALRVPSTFGDTLLWFDDSSEGGDELQEWPQRGEVVLGFIPAPSIRVYPLVRDLSPKGRELCFIWRALLRS